MDTAKLRYRINLLDDGSVVTGDGEYLGTWDTDETDALYRFSPDGAASPLLIHPFRKFLCEAIDTWNSQNALEAGL
ncbi:hypothetical protein [Sinorhizobium sp. NFACC03]|uniref:hypothetical protein n=1 Tax=Sinorhizobium sp. NFACC03 TaxID=1566295 RepID=UPI00087F0D62|nr:hypothetical protein [Sinorhizobium sp. NFACC03]SDA39530.1 hypothetical protein SAMN03159448_00197 [Sinorhizobium sp. NFACC03]